MRHHGTNSDAVTSCPVQLQNVTKRYGNRTVLEDVSFVPPGITGLVDPNGAGKSTLVRALRGLVRLASGLSTPSAGCVAMGISTRSALFASSHNATEDTAHGCENEGPRATHS